MNSLAWLIPMALMLSLFGLVMFIWAMRSGQFDDLEGAAYRILEDDPEETGMPSKDAPNADKEKTETKGTAEGMAEAKKV
ncbi:MAG: cbb3-type cytochrome oxidase assembly protein CcoS [Alphaproteobacteria bacterium]